MTDKSNGDELVGMAKIYASQEESKGKTDVFSIFVVIALFLAIFFRNGYSTFIIGVVILAN